MAERTSCIQPTRQGRPCQGRVPDGAPIALCLRHLRAVYIFYKNLTANAPGYLHPAGYRRTPGGELEHRVILRAVIGGDPHPCHWCNKMLTWEVDLKVDHVDGNKLNNDPHNLVPSCHACNVNRMDHPLLRRTHCRHGHEYTQANTARGPKGERICITCRRETGLAWYHRNKQEKPTGRRWSAERRKTHCKSGHELTLENTYFTKEGWRKCRICQAVRDQRRERPRKRSKHPA